MPKQAAKRISRAAKFGPTHGPDHQRFCYVRELMAILGVTRRTVYNYVKNGFLPMPVLQSDGRTGVHCRWPLVALDHAEFIVEHRRLGYTNREIRAMIAALWGTDDKAPPDDVPKRR